MLSLGIVGGCKAKEKGAAGDPPAGSGSAGSGSGAGSAAMPAPDAAPDAATVVEGSGAGSAAMPAPDAASAVAADAAGTTAGPKPPMTAESESLCLAVIARMVACEKDPKFRESLFKRDDPAEKAAMQKHFDTHVATWKSPAGAKAQCAKWASNEYVETHFSDPVKLKGLSAETKHECSFFAAEIVDEGGLPGALTNAKPQPK